MLLSSSSWTPGLWSGLISSILRIELLRKRRIHFQILICWMVLELVLAIRNPPPQGGQGQGKENSDPRDHEYGASTAHQFSAGHGGHGGHGPASSTSTSYGHHEHRCDYDAHHQQQQQQQRRTNLSTEDQLQRRLPA